MTEPPAVAVVTPSVLVMLKSALAPSVSVSVAESLAALPSGTAPPETVAVLEIEPVALGLIAQEAV